MPETKTTFNLVELINDEVNTYEADEVYLTDRVSFSMHKTVKKILQHQNNGFEKRSNKTRFFFNIGNSRVDTAVKKIDYDQKDIDMEAITNSPFLMLAAKEELKMFLANTSLGEKFNYFVEQFPDWGNIVAKKDTESVFSPVNLYNLKITDTTAETLEDTTVIEEHRYNATQLRKMSEIWDNVDIAIKDYNSASTEKETPVFYIYERRGEMSRNQFNKAKGLRETVNGDNEFLNTLAIVCIKRNNQRYLIDNNMAIGTTLFIEEVKPEKGIDGKLYYKPYREAHWGPYQGRWLRKGYRELLFPYQDRANVLGNQIYEAMKWSSLHVFWSPDKTVAGRNVFKSIENGQIIKAEALAVLPVEERNLSAQVNEWNRLMDMADKETQAFEVATGEKLSDATLGQVNVQTAANGQYFAFKQQKLGLFLESICNDWMLPGLEKEMNKEHEMLVNDNEKLKDLIATLQAENEANAAGIRILDRQQYIEARKEEILSNPTILVQMEKDTFKNIKKKVRVKISGENTNKQSKLNNGFQLLNLTQDPETRQQLITELAALVGFKISPPKQPLMQPQQQAQSPEQINPEMAI